MCGPSQSEQNIAKEQSNFYSTLTNAYQQMFAGQQNILDSLKGAFAPILAAGPGQYGFTPAEDAAMRTQASAGTANQYTAAQQAVGEQLAAHAGGNEFLPSGAQAQIQQQVANAAAQQESSQQLGITEAGYQQGLANFQNAAKVLGGVAEQMNPLGYAGQATGSGQAAYGSAYQNQQQSDQAWSTIGGILGGQLGQMIASGGQSSGGSAPAFGGMSPTGISAGFGGPGEASTISSTLPDLLPLAAAA